REIKAARQRLGIGEGGSLVVVVGHLRPEKGHRSLLEAHRLLRGGRTGDVHLAVVGGGPEEHELRRASGRDDHVHFLDHQDDVALWNAAADVVAVPSLTESFGLVALEAMAMGKPIVGSNVEGLVEIISDDETGSLIEPGNAVQLASALGELLASPERRAAMGEAGRARYLALFTRDRMVDGWIEVYEDALRDG
ncbi:MAG: glycosyltransferase family 4 protein, partial [Actinomycetota bacterium]|nr:glycosyltransferase family 4 protein [Actinomycetota bacterium]